MTFRKYLVLGCFLVFPLTAAAASSEQTYIVKKGDTLWGISQKFIKDPAYWPSLWANNPDIRNPHFIYPGQKLQIYDGRINIVPAPAEPPKAVEEAPTAVEEPVAAPPVADIIQPVETAPVLPPAETAVTIVTPGGRGFIAADQLEGVGILVDTVDNRIMMGTGDTVFITTKQPAHLGDRFSLFEVGGEVIHPTTGKPAGFRIVELGMLEVTAVGADVATAVIKTNFREILRGARLTPYQPPVLSVDLKKASQPISGVLLDTFSEKILQGQHDIVYVDLGAADGLEVGNLLYVSRPRMATEVADLVGELALPDVLVGNALVLDTRPHSATALLLKVLGPIYRGDRVTAVTE